jgi:hypothetical protein
VVITMAHECGGHEDGISAWLRTPPKRSTSSRSDDFRFGSDCVDICDNEYAVDSDEYDDDEEEEWDRLSVISSLSEGGIIETSWNIPRQVDYLSHAWSEPEAWESWRLARKAERDSSNRRRLENGVWRAWSKSKYKLKTIDPACIDWYYPPQHINSETRDKDEDITWLFGPFPRGPPASAASSEASQTPRQTGPRPALTRRTNSEQVLRSWWTFSDVISHSLRAAISWLCRSLRRRPTLPRPALTKRTNLEQLLMSWSSSSNLIAPAIRAAMEKENPGNRKSNIRFGEWDEHYEPVDEDSTSVVALPDIGLSQLAEAVEWEQQRLCE